MRNPIHSSLGISLSLLLWIQADSSFAIDPNSSQLQFKKSTSEACHVFHDPEVTEWNRGIKALAKHTQAQAVALPKRKHPAPLPQEQAWKHIVARTNYPGLFQCVSYCHNQIREKKFCRLEE